MAALEAHRPVFIEAESRKIGNLHVPPALLTAMRAAPALRLSATIAARVKYLISGYEEFCRDSPRFLATIEKLRPFAGNTRIAAWQTQHQNGDWRQMVADMLLNFYDLGYEKSLRTNYAAAVHAAPLTLDPGSSKQVMQLARQLHAHQAELPGLNI